MNPFDKDFEDVPPEAREFALQVLWAKSYLRDMDRSKLIVQSKHYEMLVAANDGNPFDALWGLPLRVRDVGMHNDEFVIVADGVDQLFSLPYGYEHLPLGAKAEVV